MRRFPSSSPRIRLRWRILVLILALAPFAARPAGAQGWPSAHANPANTNGYDIATSPAQAPAATVGGLGSFADGYAPVIGADGTIYLANQQGRIMAFAPNGQKKWERELGGGFGVSSTPVIASNGNLYVLSSRRIVDHRVQPPVRRIESEFNGFTAGGGFLFHFPVPQHFDGGISTAPLNILRAPNGEELVIFPMLFTGDPSPTRSARLYAYSLTGGLRVEQKMSVFTPEQSSGMDFPFSIDFGGGFSAPQYGAEYRFPDKVELPLPGVAVMPAGSPTPAAVIVPDGMHAIIAYQFDGTAFVEQWRLDLEAPTDILSTPMIGPNGDTKYVGYPGLQSLNTLGRFTSISDFNALLAATPTQAPNGRFIAVTRDEGVIAYQINTKLNSDSIVSAAAARDFVYVASYFKLFTLRADNLQIVSAFDWQNGGRVAPAIGPNGEVVAVAGGTLYIFPNNGGPLNRSPAGGTVVGNNAGVEQVTPPPQPAAPGTVWHNQVQGIQLNGGAGAEQPAAPPATDPAGAEQQAALPASQKFDPPLTASGKPLSACLDAGFADCGKKAARAFCESLGFATASDIDIDTKKGGAETLAGAICTAKKCKVVDKVTCSR